MARTCDCLTRIPKQVQELVPDSNQADIPTVTLLVLVLVLLLRLRRRRRRRRRLRLRRRLRRRLRLLLRLLRKRKRPDRYDRGVLFLRVSCRGGSLTMTYFHAKKIALSSALERFTDLFGMGRGGSTPLWSSDIGGMAGSGRLRLGLRAWRGGRDE